ncbi:MAG: hypothetical protein U5K27_16885 [Desulfotignum sp.]|nr:hypothetical protein [Desulfotignum sp.]
MEIAVQIPIEDFEKIEQLLEDYASWFHLMKRNQEAELAGSQADAETYYKQLAKLENCLMLTGRVRIDEEVSRLSLMPAPKPNDHHFFLGIIRH